MKKLVSIIIPVYNLEKILSKCLDSVINQTYKNLEIIVINDGSKDGSEAIIKNYAKKDKRIVLISQKNGGQAKARNVGISQSTGEYIMFVDGDDWIEKDTIEDMMAVMDEDVDLVLSDHFMDYPSWSKTVSTMTDYTKEKDKNLILSSCGPCFKLYRADLLKREKKLFLEGVIFEDLAIIPYINSLVRKYVYLRKPHYHYCIRENSTMQATKFLKREYNIFDALRNLTLKFGKDFPEELEFMYIREILSAYIRNLYHRGADVEKFKKELIKFLKDTYPNWKQNKYYRNQSFSKKVRDWLLLNGIEGIVVAISKIKRRFSK
jgi:glycosyltransferase involved in cell wall biosynthesis